jgi:hypothetical protein
VNQMTFKTREVGASTGYGSYPLHCINYNGALEPEIKLKHKQIKQSCSIQTAGLCVCLVSQQLDFKKKFI